MASRESMLAPSPLGKIMGQLEPLKLWWCCIKAAFFSFCSQLRVLAAQAARWMGGNSQINGVLNKLLHVVYKGNKKIKIIPRCDSRLRLHERHAGGLVAVGVDGGHHLAADGVEDGQRGERPGDLAVLRHAPQLLAGLLDGAVMHQLDAGRERKRTC